MWGCGATGGRGRPMAGREAGESPFPGAERRVGWLLLEGTGGKRPDTPPAFVRRPCFAAAPLACRP